MPSSCTALAARVMRLFRRRCAAVSDIWQCLFHDAGVCRHRV
eukprot:IDg4094t1